MRFEPPTSLDQVTALNRSAKTEATPPTNLVAPNESNNNACDAIPSAIAADPNELASPFPALLIELDELFQMSYQPSLYDTSLAKN